MTATTHPEYNMHTTALTVATAFPSGIKGRTILVTGVNRKGLGYAAAEAFASQSPELLILAGRNSQKIEECVNLLEKSFPHVKYRVLLLDLGCQQRTREAAAVVNQWDDVPKIDIVVNNAAIMEVPTRQLNEDGWEKHFATNHVGHFLFTNLIMGKIIDASQRPGSKAGDTRIVNVSSLGTRYSPVRWSDINFERTNDSLPLREQSNYAALSQLGNIGTESDIKRGSYIPFVAYGQSKTANILFGLGLNERLYEKYGILSVAVHPGTIITELSREIPPDALERRVASLQKNGIIFKELGAGASTTMVAALDPALGMPIRRLAVEKDLMRTGNDTKDGEGEWEGKGAYLSDCQIGGEPNLWSTSWDEARKLWALSQEMVGETFSY